MCSLWQRLLVIIFKIIKRIQVCGVNMTTTRLKLQDPKLLKVRGNWVIGTHSGTEFTAQRNVVITKSCPRFVR
jgi:hypothetical protein